MPTSCLAGHRPDRSWFAPLLVMTIIVGATPLAAQRPKTKKPRIAAPIDEVVRTKDGLNMAMRYYPGPKSLTTSPVIMLHGWKGQGSEFYGLAERLQHPDGGGHSVLVPDLRGHGESTSIMRPGASQSWKIRAEKIRKPELEQMIGFDMETAKNYLMRRHQNEELNINALTVVGAEMGALVAVYWTAQDWSWPQLPGVKQGQDVRAVVLLSPPQGFKGLTIQPPFDGPAMREEVSLLVVYGQHDSKAAATARRIRNSLKRFRQLNFDSDEEALREREVEFKGLDTSLQGTDLLTDRQLPTARGIARFIQLRVQDRMADHFPWTKRGNALE